MRTGGPRGLRRARDAGCGICFAGLPPRLGIAEAVDARATIVPQGFAAERRVSGEADRAVRQIGELTVVDGIDAVGPFPDPVREMITVMAAVLPGAVDPCGAKLFHVAPTASEAASAHRDGGLDPSFG